MSGRLELEGGVAQAILPEKGLLLNLEDRKLALRFSFLNNRGEITIEDWVD